MGGREAGHMALLLVTAKLQQLNALLPLTGQSVARSEETLSLATLFHSPRCSPYQIHTAHFLQIGKHPSPRHLISAVPGSELWLPSRQASALPLYSRPTFLFKRHFLFVLNTVFF